MKITIDWVRHAESCANLYNKKVTDEYSDDTQRKAMSNMVDKYIIQDDNNQSFQEIIKFGNEKMEDYIKNASCGNNNDECVKYVMEQSEYCQQDNVSHDECRDEWVRNDNKINELVNQLKKTPDEIKKIMLSILIRYKLTKSNWLFHPTLTDVGILQAKQFGKDFLNQQITNYDVILSSASVRTIMTAINSMMESEKYQYKKIIIVPFVNEKSNDAGPSGLDYSNSAIPIAIIDDVVQLIIESYVKLNNKQVTINIDTEFYKNYNYPKCDFSNETKIEFSDINRFFNETFEKINQYINNNNDIHVLIYSHGNIIQSIAELAKLDMKGRKKDPNFFTDFAKNTSVLRSLYDNCIKSHIIIGKDGNKIVDKDGLLLDPIYHKPNNGVREHKSEIHETIDNNICGLHGLRGEINKKLWNYNIARYKFMKYFNKNKCFS